MLRFKHHLLTFTFLCVAQLVAATTASAHDVRIEARGICTNNQPQITFRAFEKDLGYAHNNIKVTFNSVDVATGAFTAGNNYQFTDTKNAAGGSVSVAVTAVGDWVDGEPGGQTYAVSVTMPENCGGVGRFTGGGNTIDTASGLKMTRGFTIHCDLLLSNNLEINWPGTGKTNQFHMLQHTKANCTDDPQIEQKPPKAPVDTIVGEGTGRYNGAEGYTVVFTLIDAGEPGTSDMIAFRVFNTTTKAEVLNMPLQNITGGNVQAHYDQPHKK